MGYLSIKLSEPEFSNSLERDYCVKHQVEREQDISHINALGSTVCAMLAPLITYIISNGANNHFLEPLIVDSILVIPTLFASFKYFHSPKLKYWLVVINIICLSHWLHYLSRISVDSKIFLPQYCMTLLLICMFFVYLPFRNRIHIALMIYFFVACGLALEQSLAGINWLLVAVLFVTISSNIQVLLHRNRRHQLIAEFRDKSRYIPHQIIKSSLSSNVNLASIYKAEERFCVCISSDWRNFQKATGELTPTQVGELLGSYYSNVSDLMKSHFPNGNYFFDWIADELFAVVFSDSLKVDPAIVNQTILFTNELISSRVDFEQKHGLPKGLDVGMAAGTSVIGIFGPEGQAKATAFGEIPGLSRRIQTIGKILREQFGEADRLIFSNDIETLCSSELFSITPVKFAHQVVKDVDHTQFFYMEASPIECCLPTAPAIKNVL